MHIPNIVTRTKLWDKLAWCMCFHENEKISTFLKQFSHNSLKKVHGYVPPKRFKLCGKKFSTSTLVSLTFCKIPASILLHILETYMAALFL